MFSRSIQRLQCATILLVAAGVGTPGAEAESLAAQAKSAAEIMQSVFANRVRDGGHWRQDNKDFDSGSEAPLDGSEMRMRDSEDHGASEVIVVNAETWDGEGWNRGEPATWRRSSRGPECSG